ncbi:MAG: hypothetical protein VKL59_24655 [Nostocaceae cyanobacterium]|nr:hypothetical protein [Nostocaceae cyanobacterium]
MWLLTNRSVLLGSFWTIVTLLSSPNVQAATIAWTDWQSGSVGKPGTASGLITLSDASQIGVQYTGEILDLQTNGEFNYWNPATPYLSTTVANAPPTSDIISLVGGNSIVNTLSFSQPITNPILAIVSLGSSIAQIPVRYQFDAPFNILSSGQGYWGEGPFSKLPGNVLEGIEGHGSIQFSGTYSTISWTVPTAETWHGFTLGTALELRNNSPTSVPESTSFLSVITMGMLSLTAVRKRKQQRNC